MSENQDRRSNEITVDGYHQPVPAARPLNGFSWERVSDDLVVFDSQTMQYHTLNGAAEKIWRSCDGVATIDTIAAAANLPAEVVETTIAELGEASLLQTPSSSWSASMSRRRAAKLIAAGAVGSIGAPVVLSLTAPYSASAVTCGSASEHAPCGDVGVGATCGQFVCCYVVPDCSGNSGGPEWQTGGVGFGPGCTAACP